MFSRRLLPVLAIFHITVMCSCSVKEDRDSCPCKLTLAVSAPEADSVFVGLGRKDLLLPRDEVVPEYAAEVPRGRLRLAVAAGEISRVSALDGVTAAPEHSFPRVWLAQKILDTRGESARDSVVLHKRWCEIFLTVKQGKAQAVPMALEIAAGCSGYDAAGKPIRSPMACVEIPDASGKCSFCVPQQADNDLRLLVETPSGVVRTFSLGSVLAQGGYNWRAEDLEDVYVDIDIAVSSITVGTDMWSRTIELELVI